MPEARVSSSRAESLPPSIARTIRLSSATKTPRPWRPVNSPSSVRSRMARLEGFKKVDWEKVAKSRSLWSEEFNKAMR